MKKKKKKKTTLEYKYGYNKLDFVFYLLMTEI